MDGWRCVNVFCQHTWQCLSTDGPQQADGTPVTCQELLHFLLNVTAIHSRLFNHHQHVLAAFCFNRRVFLVVTVCVGCKRADSHFFPQHSMALAVLEPSNEAIGWL